jgi:DNA-binding NarL/FixJ family response regulator
MTKHLTPALIVAKPGSLHDGLLALLTAIPQLDVVGEADDADLALQMVAKRRPELVLMDADLPQDEAWEVLGKIKTEWPAMQCVVLAGDVQQRQAAEAAGADIVLLKGIPAAKLIASIEALCLKAPPKE